MNISPNNIKLIEKIDKLSKKYGYIKDTIGKIEIPYEKDIINLITWFDTKDKNGNTFINILQYPYTQ